MNGWKNAYAFVIGLNKYENLSTLSCCINDAIKFSEAIKNKLPNINLKLLIGNGDNEFPSFDILESTLIDISSLKLTENDIVFFYFAGHGFSSEGSDYLTCYNTDRKNLKSTSISTEKIIAALNKSNVGTSILIIDACRNNVDRDLTRELFGKNTAELARRNGIITFFSCSPGEFSQELFNLENGHGIFTYAFIKSLNECKSYTALELDKLLLKYVNELVSLHNLSVQRPYTVVAPLQKSNLDIIANKIVLFDNIGRRKCILIAGSTNAGKSTLGQYLAREYGYVHVEMSSFAYKRYESRPKSYIGSIQDFMEDEIWSTYPKDIIAQDLLESDTDNQNLVISGPRLPEEIETLISQKWDVIPIFLFSDTKSRYIRYQTDKGISRYGLNFKEFIQKDMRELSWGLAKAATMSQLEIVINDETINELFTNVQKRLKSRLKK